MLNQQNSVGVHGGTHLDTERLPNLAMVVGDGRNLENMTLQSSPAH